jgi:hypothetical protein
MQYKPKKEYYGEEKHEEKKSSYGYKKEEKVRHYCKCNQWACSMGVRSFQLNMHSAQSLTWTGQDTVLNAS